MVTYRGGANAAGDTTYGPVNVTIPATVQVGDLLLYQATSGGAAIGAPAGWTLLTSASSSMISTWIYSRVAQAGDAGSTVNVAAPSASRCGGIVVAYADAGSPLVVGAGVASSTTPSVTAPNNGSMLVGLWAAGNDPAPAITVPASMVERQTASPGWSRATIGDETVPAGATGSRTCSSATGTANFVAASVLIPSLGPTPINVTGESFTVTASAPSGAVRAYPITVAGEAFRVAASAPQGVVSGAEVRVLGEAFAVTSTALDGTAQTSPAAVPLETSTQYADLSGYNYGGVGEVDYDPPVVASPTRVKPSPIRRVHQSLPAPTLVDGRPV